MNKFAILGAVVLGLGLVGCGGGEEPKPEEPKAKAKKKAKSKEKAKQKAKAKADEVDITTLKGPVDYGEGKKYNAEKGDVCCKRKYKDEDAFRPGLAKPMFSVGKKDECGKDADLQGLTLKAGEEVEWGYCVQFYRETDVCCVNKFMGTPTDMNTKKRQECWSATGSDWYEGTCDDWKKDGGKVKAKGGAGKAKGKGKKGGKAGK